jgi:hypothetical protein
MHFFPANMTSACFYIVGESFGNFESQTFYRSILQFSVAVAFGRATKGPAHAKYYSTKTFLCRSKTSARRLRNGQGQCTDYLSRYSG